MFAFTACKKNPVVETSQPVEAFKTERGTTSGLAVNKTIGIAGGELTSSDGRITLSVPTGAVTSNTQFSIQPIKNTLDTTSSKPAYRLLPEGVSFAKPVRLIFNYDALDLKNTKEDLLIAAWQQPNGSWKAVPTSLNKTAKTLIIQTSHFSDWLVTGEISLSVNRANLAPGESTTVSIMGVNHDDDDLLAPLSPSGWSGTITQVRNWDVLQGPGDLSSVEGDENSGDMIRRKKYTAPTAISRPDKATIQVVVDGNITIPDSTAPGGKRVFQNMVLLGEVNIVANVYMIGNFGPIDINIGEVTALLSNGRINIAAHDANISVGFITNGTAGSNFPSGDIMIPGFSVSNAAYSLSPTQSFSFGSSFQECNPSPVTKYSGGALTLQKWGAVGEPVQGEFSGILYSSTGTGQDGCPTYDKRMLSVRFRTVRSL